jgi:hypothetical protein
MVVCFRKPVPNGKSSAKTRTLDSRAEDKSPPGTPKPDSDDRPKIAESVKILAIWPSDQRFRDLPLSRPRPQSKFVDLPISQHGVALRGPATATRARITVLRLRFCCDFSIVPDPEKTTMICPRPILDLSQRTSQCDDPLEIDGGDGRPADLPRPSSSRLPRRRSFRNRWGRRTASGPSEAELESPSEMTIL